MGEKKLYLVAAIVLLLGCVSPIFGERFQASIQPGMTTTEVKAVMGNPDGYEQREELELYRYTDKMVSGWGWNKANYVVLFKNGKVIQYGIDSMRFREWVPAQTNRTDVYIHK